MFCFHKIPFFVASFLLKKDVSMILKKTALAKNSANKILWKNIVDGAKIHDIMFIL